LTNSVVEFLADYFTFLGVRFQYWMIVFVGAFALWVIAHILIKKQSGKSSGEAPEA
jgi:hypothetical protein